MYESWAHEDAYMPLADEVRMLARAGFTVDVPWRQSPFAVIVGVKGSDGRLQSGTGGERRGSDLRRRGAWRGESSSRAGHRAGRGQR